MKWFTLFLWFSLGFNFDRQALTYHPDSTEENFDKFFRDFCQNPKFQLERIKFPLKIVVVEEENRTEKLIQEKEWRHTNLLKLKRENSKNVLKTVDREPDAKDVVFTNDKTGEVVHHLFSRVDNRWYLMSIVDESD